MIEKARLYAIACHLGTNDFYDKDKPYSVHLQMVYNTAIAFIHLIPEPERENVLAACWTHDVMENCRQNYTNVREATNLSVAELTYALTNEKGKNRKERGNSKYYSGIKKTPFATFVKICDRIANLEYSKQTGSSKAEMYRNENMDFIAKLWDSQYREILEYLIAMAKEESVK